METDRRLRRLVTLVAAALIVAALSAGPAAAFEPPGNEPADLFSCDPTAVTGHPGSKGQSRAIATGNTSAAWNAHFNGGGVGNC
jgi:hypothetical protein